MSVRSLLVALAIGAMGCGGSPPALATFPKASVAFSPDGADAVVKEIPRVFGYDLDKKAVRWEHLAKRENVGIAFAPRGKYVLIVEADDDPHDASLTLLRTDDGSRVFAKLVEHERPGDPRRYVERAARLFAVSDDGAFVACALDRLEVLSTADGTRVHSDALEREFGVVAFQPGTHRLVFSAAHNPRMRVADRVDGVFRTVETFEGAFDPTWTSAGLIFGSPAGLELWDGKARRTVLPAAQVFPHAVSYDSEYPTRWCASPDGAYLASWTRERLSVWRTSDGGRAPLFTHDDEPPASLAAMLFSHAVLVAGHFRGFTLGGYFLDLEIPSGRVVRRTSFGPIGSMSKSVFTDGARYTSNYVPSLTPPGRYFAITTADDGANVYAAEP